MDIENITNSSVKLHHDSCRKAYENDRALTKEQKESAEQQSLSRFEYFGVDEHTDWPAWVRALEVQMDKREITYEPIEI